MSLVLRNVASYQEITTFWDLNEVHDALEILDIQTDLEAQQVEEMKAQSQTRRR